MQRQDIAAGGILVLNGKVLIIRRSSGEVSSAGYWEFPKGKVEFEESPEQAMTREFLEETGLSVKADKLFKTYSHTYTREGVNVHLIEIEYLVNLTPGESIENIKLDANSHDQWKLVSAEEAKTLSPMYKDKLSSLLTVLGASNN